MQFAHGHHGHGHGHQQQQQHFPQQQFPQQSFSQQPFYWERFNGSLPQNAVYACHDYAVIKADNGSGDHVVGKYNLSQRAAYIPYGGQEQLVKHGIEVLCAAPGSQINWVPASHGSVPQGAIGPIGKDGLFVGRAVCPHPENKYTPGKVHPTHKCLYMPWGGKEERFDKYEVCVITQAIPFHWEKFHGSLPHGTVYACNDYAVIRAEASGDMVVGKYNLQQKAAYIPYGGKEVHVTHNIEVLVAAPGAKIQWVTAGHGSFVQGAIGPVGKDGLFVGRAVCPQPENKYTPGKVHPAHKCLYMPWGGKEQKYDNYEVCVIKF